MHKQDHKKITEFAIKEFQQVFSPQFNDFLQSERYNIAKGSVWEDEEIHTPERVTNWHFYEPEDSAYFKPFWSLLKPVLGVNTHPSSRTVFKKYADRIDGGIFSNFDKQSVITIGRLIHHIQDMCTPAHVVPVYHGPTLHPFHFPAKNDGFEKFSITNIDSFLLKKLIQFPKERLIGKLLDIMPDTLFDLYDSTAQDTLKYLRDSNTQFTVTVNGNEVKRDTSLFWIPFDPDQAKQEKTDGFGSYGIFGESMGKKYILTANYHDDVYSLQLDNYSFIYKDLLQKMVFDTLVILLYIENMALPFQDK
jgi:hypothetical protein